MNGGMRVSFTGREKNIDLMRCVLYTREPTPPMQPQYFSSMKESMDTPCLPDGLTLREVFRQLQADDLEWP